VGYDPRFSVTPRLLAQVEAIAALRERILGATIELSWVPALQKDTRTRNVHASTAIEGNPLTLEQVRALEEGRELAASDRRSEREVLNYLAGLRFLEKHAKKQTIQPGDVFTLHRLLTKGVMDQGEPGAYRTVRVRVGRYQPPAASAVPDLIVELLDWWNLRARELSPVLSSAILHYRLEAIHPFADGNGRAGRALALWELYRRGFDTHHIFSVDEYYWENRPAYYDALEQVRQASDDLSHWLEYSAEGLRQTLDRVWLRVQQFSRKSTRKLVLRPRQERLLGLLRDHGSMAPAEIWDKLGVSRQGAMDLLRPLLEAGLVRKIGSKKTGRYILRRRS
jgi:Fic family protein